MLIQFAVENFLSIRAKVYLSLEPSKDKEHSENILAEGEYSAVNAIAIYGANASGKSSLFKAIQVALGMLRNSNNVQVTEELPVTPFKFDTESKNKPTAFEFTFVAADNKKYIYGFQATKEKIVEEYLYCYTSAKATLIFDVTDGAEPKFNRAYKGKLEAAYQMNTAKKLFLATATSWNVECTNPPFTWLAEHMETFTDISSLSGAAFEKYRTDETKKYIEFTKTLLHQADINISSIQIKTEEVHTLGGRKYALDITTGHTVTDKTGHEQEFTLGFFEESLGTQQLFFYGPFLQDAFEKGKTIIIDEIDKSLHPSIVKFVMNLFRDGDVNKNNAQIIVTTHDTGLLSLDMFRRDQIYFTEKDAATGVTDLYSLDEFSVRKTENIEKGYLMGRYGAVPFLQTEEVL